jgi:hypothetical protein
MKRSRSVTIPNHATAVFNNRKGATILLPHDLCGYSSIRLGTAGSNVFVHYVLNLHGIPLIPPPWMA